MPIDSSSEPGAWQRELDARPRVEVAKWAMRNGELHKTCRKLLDAYRAVCPDDPFIWEVERVLADVPQERR